MSLRPADLHPDFEQDRLTFLADLISACRAAALELYRPDSGETPWSLGCRCYDRITFAIAQAAAGGRYPWLTIVNKRAPGEPFIFRIGTQPLKFYTGSSSSPSTRSLRVDPPEIRAMTLFGPADGTPANVFVWRLAVGVDGTGRVAQVTLIEVNKAGYVRQSFSIPFSGNPAGTVVSFFPDGITLPPPDVGTWDEEAEVGNAGRNE